MLSRLVRILNFDGSVAQQRGLIDRFAPVIVNLKTIGPHARLWSNKKVNNIIRRSLRQELRNAVTFLGSGDFHHVSHLLIEQFAEPITVILFDHHPDWDILPPRSGCGAWVSRILERPNVAKVISLGMASDDLGFPSLLSANFSSLIDDRLEIYPFSASNARVFFRSVPKNRSVETSRGFLGSKILWKPLKGKDLKKFFEEILPHIPTKKVYISIDKDCLTSEGALTNWEQGAMPVEGFLTLLKAIKGHLDIAGVDVAGDYSRPVFASQVKKLCSFFDHPKKFSARNKSEDIIREINQRTNLAILETLF